MADPFHAFPVGLQMFLPSGFHYEHLIQEWLARDLAREPQWTESIAVGSRGFVDEIAPDDLAPAPNWSTRPGKEALGFCESDWTVRRVRWRPKTGGEIW